MDRPGLIIVFDQRPDRWGVQPLVGLRLPGQYAVFSDGLIENVLPLHLPKSHEEHEGVEALREAHDAVQSPATGLSREGGVGREDVVHLLSSVGLPEHQDSHLYLLYFLKATRDDSLVVNLRLMSLVTADAFR